MKESLSSGLELEHAEDHVDLVVVLRERHGDIAVVLDPAVEADIGDVADDRPLLLEDAYGGLPNLAAVGRLEQGAEALAGAVMAEARRDGGADQAVAEIQRRALDVDEHDVGEEIEDFRGLDVAARRHAAAGALAVPIVQAL